MRDTLAILVDRAELGTRTIQLAQS
jgi:hypothetical protein